MTWRCCVCQREKLLSAALEGNVSGGEPVTYGLCQECYEKALENIQTFAWARSEESEE